MVEKTFNGYTSSPKDRCSAKYFRIDIHYVGLHKSTIT